MEKNHSALVCETGALGFLLAAPWPTGGMNESALSRLCSLKVMCPVHGWLKSHRLEFKSYHCEPSPTYAISLSSTFIVYKTFKVAMRIEWEYVCRTESNAGK